jgi:hypothetical protein
MERKEWTFKPKLNKTATLSPSPKYKYYDLKKNLESSYTKQMQQRNAIKQRDNYELYGKYIKQKLGKFYEGE